MHELTFYGLSRATLNCRCRTHARRRRRPSPPRRPRPAGPWIGPRDTRLYVTQDIQDGRSILTGPPLTMAGVYGPATGDTRPVLAVNPDIREADIRHVTNQQMAAALGTDVGNMLDNPSLIAWQDSAHHARLLVGPSLVLVALGLFLLEAILALAFSTYR